MKLTRTTEAEHFSLDARRHIIVDDHSHAYFRLEIDGQGACGIACHSTLIEPTAVVASDGKIWVGIDTHLVCLSRSGQVVLTKTLQTNLIRVLLREDCVIALGECDVIVFGKDLSIRLETLLPDVISGCHIQNGIISIETMDARTFELTY